MPIISGGGGGGGGGGGTFSGGTIAGSTVTVTPAQIRASNTAGVAVIPAPGAGLAIMPPASMYFIFGAGFVAYGGAASFSLVLTTDATGGSSAFSVTVSDLATELNGGVADAVILVDWGAAIGGSQLGGPTSLMQDAPLYLFASAAPTGGAGDITVVSVYTAASV